VLLVVGVAVVVHSFARFALEGLGTPVPVAPARRLVVGGLYRYVRNPIYIADTAVIVGQALLLGQPWLLLYAAAFLAVTAAFVRFYEEPTLSRQFGAEYDAYRQSVPGWWPGSR
jgi:protein-S-isoprenylcysteine O-methyltransferase Ste14